VRTLGKRQEQRQRQSNNNGGNNNNGNDRNNGGNNNNGNSNNGNSNGRATTVEVESTVSQVSAEKHGANLGHPADIVMKRR
jgi:hypothetical protein